MGKPLHRQVIPAAFTLLLYEYLKSHGQDPEVLLGMPWPSTDPEEKSSVDVGRWEQMLASAADHLDDPLLGLHLGRIVTARHLGVVGHLLRACEDLNSVLLRLEHFQRLIFDVIPMFRRDKPDCVEIVWDISEHRTTILVGETGFAVMVQFCRSLMQGDAHPMGIEFAHPQPDDIRPYEQFFRCPVLFARPEPLIRVSRDLLARPLKRPDLVLEQVLEQHAERLLSRLPKQDEVITQVRSALAALLRDGEPDIEKVSAMLRCSGRTLQRRLKAADTHFRAEMNFVRNELARSYLQDVRLQVSDIAMLLGYSEHSAFTRAFRKRNGLTPQQMREQTLQR